MKKVFLFAALACSLTGFSQKVSPAPMFTKGQKLELVTKSNSVVSMEMMGQTMETKIDATITRHIDVENVENGSATLEHKMKRMQMNIEAPMGGSQSFDSENASDMKGEGGRAAEKALKNKYTVVVDANGRVKSVTADDDNKNKTAEADGMSQMAGVGELPRVGTASELTILPAGGVEKGTAWTDTTGGHQFQYTVTDISADEILVNFTDQTKTERKQQANGMDITISTTDKSNGTVKVDRKTGLLKERASTTNSEGTMELMGQTVPMTSKVVLTTTVK